MHVVMETNLFRSHHFGNNKVWFERHQRDCFESQEFIIERMLKLKSNINYTTNIY